MVWPAKHSDQVLTLQSIGDGNDDSLNHGSLDESGGSTGEFVPVVKNRIDLLNETIVVLLVPVVTQVFLPVKVVRVVDLAFRQSFDHVDLVDVDGHQRTHQFQLNSSQQTLEQLGLLLLLDVQRLQQVEKRILLVCDFVNSVLREHAPHYLGHHHCYLRLMREDPLVASFVRAV